jgi:hypothetical protein
MQARAQMTDVNVSGPNFSGTRVVTGRKYRSTETGWMSVRISPHGCQDQPQTDDSTKV